jgi:hypothetical protein
MWIEFGALTFAFLQSRCGFVGNVVADSLVSLGNSPGSPGAPLMKLVRAAAHNWTLRHDLPTRI